MFIQYISLIFVFQLLTSILCIPCTKDDVKYAFTQCDKSGHRWLVRVPKSNVSCDISTSKLKIVQQARKCGMPCRPGTYLDTETQKCKDCEPGTYSLGDIVEIDDWRGPKLPDGFITRASSNEKPENACKEEKWKPNGEFISASVLNCNSHLYFGASLYKPGQLTIRYQMPDDEIIFKIKITNDDCALKSTDSRSKSHQSKFLDSTPPSTWKTVTFDLQKGHNSIRFLASSMGTKSHKSNVKIEYFRVTNSVFTSQCIKCPAGSYSGQGSRKCTLCQRDKYTDTEKSPDCKQCEDDEYAEPGSKKCTKRLACTKKDYFYKYTDCSKEGKRHKVYYWLEPRICSPVLPGSVKKPDNQKLQKLESCSTCPYGTQVNSSDAGRCAKCPAGYASDLANPGKCKKCPVQTRPVQQIQYTSWTRQLPDMAFRCLHNDKFCKNLTPWLLAGDYLQSEPSNDVNILTLKIDPIPYKNPYGKRPVAMSDASFEFSMDCKGPCLLHLFLTQTNYSTSRVNTWVNSTERQAFRFGIERATPGQLVWFFHRQESTAQVKNRDSLKIYSINVTRVKNAGATHCQYCDGSSSENSCLDCSKDKYYSQKEKKCVKCPNGKVLKNYPGKDITDCVKCGDGLISLDGLICVPNGFYKTKNNNTYDLSVLKKPLLLSVGKQFTTMGHEYHYVYNMSIIIDSVDQLAQCHNNQSRFEDGIFDETAPICRLTMIKDSSKNNTIYAVLALSLADEFVSMKQSNESANFGKKMNDSLEQHGYDKDKYGTDLYVKLSTPRKTDVCNKGRQTTVVLRCSKQSEDDDDDSSKKAKDNAPSLLLPPKCLSGTCDGCNFMMMIKSEKLCPYCRENDLQIIKEQCDASGYQIVHYRTSKFCIPSKHFKSKVVVKCPLFTFRTMIILFVTTVVLMGLTCTIIYCHKKNKSLEYKYSRLISGNENSDEPVMMGAESCAMTEGDEDEDDVKIKSSSKTGNIFAKFNRQPRRQGNNNYEDTEQLRLDDSADFDL